MRRFFSRPSGAAEKDVQSKYSSRIGAIVPQSAALYNCRSLFMSEA